MAYARIKCGLGASLLVAILVFAAKPAQSQQIWDGGTGNWSDPKWSGGSTWISGSNALFSVAGGGTVTAGTESVGSISFANTTGYTITGGTLTRSSASIVAGTALQVNTINSVLAGSTGLTKTGLGQITLGGLNTYTGATTISTGTVSINTIANSGINSSLGQGGIVGAGAIVFAANTTLRYTGASATTNRGITASGNGIVDVAAGQTLTMGDVLLSGGNITVGATGGGGGTLILGNVTLTASKNINTVTGSAECNNFSMAANNTTFDTSTGVGTGTTVRGVVSGSGTVSKSGSSVGGYLTLLGPNTYTGQTLIVRGNVNVTSLNSINGGTPLLASSSLGAPTDIAKGTIKLGASTQTPLASLTYTGTGETTDRVIDLGGTTSGGTLDQSGTGLLKFTSFNGTTNTFTASGNGVKTLTLQGSTAGTGEIAAAIVNSTSATNLTKNGTGTWTLSGANTYTGTTSVSAGTLRIGGSGTLGNVSAGIGNYAGSITIASTRSLVYASSAAQTLGGVISGTGGALSAEAGTLSLTGANTYTGATTVSGGTLLVNGSGSLAASAVTVNSGAFGGSGSIGSTLSLLNSSSFHVVDLADPLQVSGTIDIYAGFGVNNLVGIDWSTTAFNTYTLITGSLGAGVFNGLNNNSLATAQNVGSGRIAYFQEGSLQLVVANVPEPSAALLGVLAPLLGTLTLLRRRRRGPCLGPR